MSGPLLHWSLVWSVVFDVLIRLMLSLSLVGVGAVVSVMSECVSQSMRGMSRVPVSNVLKVKCWQKHKYLPNLYNKCSISTPFPLDFIENDSKVFNLISNDVIFIECRPKTCLIFGLKNIFTTFVLSSHISHISAHNRLT